jgi:hypothetical protein
MSLIKALKLVDIFFSGFAIVIWSESGTILKSSPYLDDASSTTVKAEDSPYKTKTKESSNDGPCQVPNHP